MKKICKLFCTFVITILLSYSFFAKPASADTTYVSGLIVNQSWTSAESPYVMTGDILIAGLTVYPGVEILAGGNYEFQVAGVINAIGNEQNPILFSTISSVASWKGILFQNSNPGSNLKWCIIEKSINSGIRIVESLPTLIHCNIRNNQSASHGGGIKISNTIPGDMLLADCNISNNFTPSGTGTPSNGGGIYVVTTVGTVEIVRCTLENNQASKTNGTISGGGAYASGKIFFEQCIFRSNSVIATQAQDQQSSYAYGAGIYVADDTITFANCRIIQNKARATENGFQAASYGYGGGCI